MNTKTLLLGIFMIIGGLGHFAIPAFYDAFIPDFLPKAFFNYGAGVFEILLGLGLFWRPSLKWAAAGILLLMVAFLPIHFFDIFKEVPAVGSKAAALVRFPLQFALIYWAFLVRKDSFA